MEGSRSETSAAEASEEIIYTSVKFSQTPPPRAKAGQERRGKEAGRGRSRTDFILSESKIKQKLSELATDFECQLTVLLLWF